jgi:hydrogenase maturation protease
LTTLTKARCLILACGNTLRGDDGLGPWLAQWAQERFPAQASLRILSPQQWTPELAEEIACARAVLFIDSSISSAPGSICLLPVEPATGAEAFTTHHMGAAELLALAERLYSSLPHEALLLTVGAGSTQLGENFSNAVKAALPEACRVLEETVLRLLEDSSARHNQAL